MSISAALPVTVAAGHLKAGKLDDLVFDLADSVPIPPDDTAAAARLLGQGAVQAEQKGDPMLALQLAQTAHRRDPKQLDALKVLTERAMHDQSFTEADGYADTLESLAPSDVHLTLLRAQVAAAEEDWDRATSISGLLLGKTSLSKTEQKEAQQIHDRAALAVAHRGAADDALAAQRQQLHAAAEVAAQQRDEAFKADAVGKRIVVYGTSWVRVLQAGPQVLCRSPAGLRGQGRGARPRRRRGAEDEDGQRRSPRQWRPGDRCLRDPGARL